MAEKIIYQRTDGKWAWRLKANNGLIVATDAGQGYENRSDAETMVDHIVGGGYKDAKKTIANKPKALTVEDLRKALFAMR